jgi:hypothetical protein
VAELSGPTAGQWEVESATANGRDVLDFGLEVGLGAPPAQEIVVTLTQVRQDVSGRLETSDPDLGTTTIVAFPEDARFWGTPSRRIQRAKPATDGSFSIPHLPAGAYCIALVKSLNPADLADSAFLTELANQSIRIDLEPGRSRTDLAIRPRSGN